MAARRHLDRIQDVTPSTPEGCTECLQTGSSWVHLRECLSCGHIGCCDSSPNRHATARYQESSHPVMRSSSPARTGAGATSTRPSSRGHP